MRCHGTYITSMLISLTLLMTQTAHKAPTRMSMMHMRVIILCGVLLHGTHVTPTKWGICFFTPQWGICNTQPQSSQPGNTTRLLASNSPMLGTLNGSHPKQMLKMWLATPHPWHQSRLFLPHTLSVSNDHRLPAFYSPSSA